MRALKNKADLLLALLYAGEDLAAGTDQLPTRIIGITRLEKLLFLSKMEGRLLDDVPDEDDFHFIPFRMGPWSQEVYDEVDFLESLGLVDKGREGRRSAADAAHDDELFSDLVLDKYQASSLPGDDEAEVFELTDFGKKKALAIWRRLSDDERRWFVNLKRRFNRMNLKLFLRYVYRRHPEFTTESEIKDYLKVAETRESS